jgi:hypothetical protein
VVYHITVERTGRGNQVSLEVNGAALPGTLVPLPQAGTKMVNVKATLR